MKGENAKSLKLFDNLSSDRDKSSKQKLNIQKASNKLIASENNESSSFPRGKGAKKGAGRGAGKGGKKGGFKSGGKGGASKGGKRSSQGRPKSSGGSSGKKNFKK